MVIRIPRRMPKPAPAQEDALVPDAVSASTPAPAKTTSLKTFPGPDAKRINCAFCGHAYYLPCVDDEHKGCMNFHAAQAKKAKAAGNSQPIA